MSIWGVNMLDFGKLIEESIVFTPMSEDDKGSLIQALVKESRKYTFSPGELLTCAKEPARSYFLLEKGTLLVEYADGRSFVSNTCGDFLGPGLVCAKREYTATTIALEEGLVHVIDRDRIANLMGTHVCENSVDYRAGFLKEKAVEIL